MSIKNSVLSLLFDKGPVARLITSAFHLSYYRSKAWLRNTYLGYPLYQCPFDLHLYQELLFRLRPLFIIQTGVAHGGSILYFATLLDLIDPKSDAFVIGIDVRLTDSAKTLKHPRIHLIEGSSTDSRTIDEIGLIVKNRVGAVILDSDHRKAHVLAEMNAYKRFVGVESYLIVEDTNVNGHPVYGSFGDGPMEAVWEFLRNDDCFVSDEDLWKKNKVSFHKHGWLKRTR